MWGLHQSRSKSITSIRASSSVSWLAWRSSRRACSNSSRTALPEDRREPAACACSYTGSFAGARSCCRAIVVTPCGPGACWLVTQSRPAGLTTTLPKSCLASSGQCRRCWTNSNVIRSVAGGRHAASANCSAFCGRRTLAGPPVCIKRPRRGLICGGRM